MKPDLKYQQSAYVPPVSRHAHSREISPEVQKMISQNVEYDPFHTNAQRHKEHQRRSEDRQNYIYE